MPSSDEPKQLEQRPKTPENPNGAGRRKGGKNKDKKGLIDRMQRMAFELWGIEEWTPFDSSLRVASCPDDFIEIMDDGKPMVDENGASVKEKIDPAYRLACAKFVAEFTYPKLKSIELTPAGIGGRFKVNLRVNVEARKPIELTPVQQEAIDALDEA